MAIYILCSTCSLSPLTKKAEASTFSIGERVYIVNTLRVHKIPSNSTDSIVGAHPAGSFGTIISGPKVTSAYTWWQVDYDSGADGWSASNWLFRAPIQTIAKKNSIVSSTNLSGTIGNQTGNTAVQVGNQIQTTANLKVRSAPSANGAPIGKHTVGSKGTVTAGPVSANGYKWWHIEYRDGLSGWSAQDWLAPAASSAPVIPISTADSAMPSTANDTPSYSGEGGGGSATRAPVIPTPPVSTNTGGGGGGSVLPAPIIPTPPVSTNTGGGGGGNPSISAPTPTTYTLNASSDVGGTISPTGSTKINSGASQTYLITAASGKKISTVSIDGKALSGTPSSYVFSNVTANHTIHATFAVSTTTPPLQLTAPTITSFKAGTSTITTGKSTSLTWIVTGTPTPSISINQGIGTIIGTSLVLISPTTTKVYTLTASNTSGTKTAQVTVIAIAPSTSTPTANDQPPATPATAGSSAAAQIGHTAGISAGWPLSQMTPAAMNAYLDRLVELKATWVRFDIDWDLIQKDSQNAFDWSKIDSLVAAINSHHLSGLGILQFTPAWARNSACASGNKCPPNKFDQFATFAAAAATRYKDKGIHTWEIWNEPNNAIFWAPRTDCAAYTSLLKITYTAIKTADPGAVVLSGGLAPEPTDTYNTSQADFLKCIYTNGGKEYFDVLADHSYTFPALPSDNNTNMWAQMAATNPSLRSIMSTNGDSHKKMWITEFGTPTNGPDSNTFVDEARQSLMVTSAMTLYKTYDWAGPIFWYTLNDLGISTSTIENFFGLIRADGSLKPAFTTLKNIINAGL
ncbi:MAG: glycoside hydrolase family 5 [Candidatus Parcubacteria bacterium]|nr:glycoside hydrolase family 5 [Candidatus Parcubacteria bacterium]